MDYVEVKDYLLSPAINVSRPGLDRIKTALAFLDNPQKNLKVIHVVGTNGKGSVSHMLGEILVNTGYRTGLFSSPYISELTEYISVDNILISRQAFAGISEYLIESLKTAGIFLTHFEFVTVLSVLYFVEKGCDFCIYEAGLGGINDATNIFDTAECTVLTSLGIEHSAYLGTTLEEIAANKAGIAHRGEVLISSDVGNRSEKSGCSPETGCQAGADCYEEKTGAVSEAGKAVRRYCEENGIRLRGICTEKLVLKERTLDRLVFDYGEIKDITLNTGALYQLQNAAAAIEAALYLDSNLSKTSVLNGLSAFRLKSRFEIIRSNPLILVDGGHNPSCVRELKKSLTDGERYMIVTGVMSDKDYAAMYEELREYASCFICVDNNMPRALPSHILCGVLEKYGIPVYNAKDTFTAAALVKRMSGAGDKVLFLGTLYMTDRFKEDIELVYCEKKLHQRYEETVKRLTSKSFYSKNYSIDDMKLLLGEFDSPQEKLNVIHVAGTNGKGSTCSMIYTALEKLGFRTGLFTSPYIRVFNERISFHGKRIEDEMLTAIAAQVIDTQNRLKMDLNQFALVTCICFIYYHLVGVDFVVLETGLGGTYDPTNIVQRPVCTVITNIGLDHTAVLGSTIEEIAGTKAGIIKKDVPVVCYPVESAAFSVIRKRAEELSAPLIHLSEEDVVIENSGMSGTDFVFQGRRFHTSLAGDFQAYNAAAAVLALEAVRDRTDTLKGGDAFGNFFERVSEALSEVQWKGRLELVCTAPVCYIDGGHNVQCIRSVTAFFDVHYKDRKKIYIAGFMKDKDYGNMISVLSESADVLYLVPVNYERSLSFWELTQAANQYNIDIKVFDGLEKAYQKAVAAADDRTVICIIGSLYQLNDFYLLKKQSGGLHE